MLTPSIPTKKFVLISLMESKDPMFDSVATYWNNFNIIFNQTLNVYDSFGKLMKTIKVKKSIYIPVAK